MRVPEKTQAAEQKPVQDFPAVLTLVTVRSDTVRNDGSSTSTGAGQGKTCLVYALQYISYVYSCICHFGIHPIPGCLVFNQKIHSFNAMTQTIKKFASLVK